MLKQDIYQHSKEAFPYNQGGGSEGEASLVPRADPLWVHAEITLLSAYNKHSAQGFFIVSRHISIFKSISLVKLLFDRRPNKSSDK